MRVGFVCVWLLPAVQRVFELDMSDALLLSELRGGLVSGW